MMLFANDSITHYQSVPATIQEEHYERHLLAAVPSLDTDLMFS